MTTQMCNACGVTRPISDFEHQKDRKSPRKTCKECRYTKRDREKEKSRHRAYMKERRKSDPLTVRENWERCQYGVSKSDFEYKECWICGSTDRLSIDHDHATGQTRGLLCGRCNSGLGFFQDDPERLAKAIRYLKDGPHWELSA